MKAKKKEKSYTELTIGEFIAFFSIVPTIFGALLAFAADKSYIFVIGLVAGFLLIMLSWYMREEK